MPGTPNYTGLAGHSHDTLPQAGVLLVNLGTPDAPTAAAVRPTVQPDVTMIADRLQRLTDKALHKKGARVLLAQVAIQKKH